MRGELFTYILERVLLSAVLFILSNSPAPSMCSFPKGELVPMPKLLPVLSQYKFALDDSALVPLQKATRVAVPLPVSVPPPPRFIHAEPVRPSKLVPVQRMVPALVLLVVPMRIAPNTSSFSTGLATSTPTFWAVISPQSIVNSP